MTIKSIHSSMMLFFSCLVFANTVWSGSGSSRSELLTCTTVNGLDVIVETRGQSSGVALYDQDIWTLAPDEYVSVELAANVICDRMEIRQVEYSGNQGKLKFLCLRPGDSAYFEIPLICRR